MRNILSWPIRVHLLFLVLLLALPSLALIIYWGVEARNQAVVDAKGECLEFVHAIASEQQADLAGVQQLMSTLALLPEVQSKNGPATNTLLSDLVKKNPLFANIVISDKAGLLWASAIPYKGEILLAGRRYFQQAVLSGFFSSGEFALGRIVNKPVITFAQPITTSSNDLRGVIAVSLNLDQFQTLFERVDLPAGSSFSLLDHRGIILHMNSRDALSEQLIGKRDVTEDLFTRMTGEYSEGTYEAVGNDGRDRLVAYKRLSLPHEAQPYLYIRSSTLRDTIVSQANAAMVKRLATATSVFAVGLILALLIAKRMIVSPVEKLKKASLQLTAGPALVNVSENVKEGELGELAQAFDGMAKALLRKEEERLADEQVLKFEREQLLSLFDSMDSIIYVSDPSTNEILYMNKTMEKIFGKQALGGICYREFQGLEAPCSFCTNEIILRQDPAPCYWEYYNPKIDRHFTIIDRLIKWPDGRKVRCEVATDITERKQAEDKLKANEKKLSEIYASMTEGLALHEIINDHSGKAIDYIITDVNPAFEKITGLKRDQVIGKKASAAYGTGEAPYLDPYAGVASTGMPVTFEGHFAPMNKYFNISVFSPDNGKFATIFQDITDRKLAEESVERFKALMDHNPSLAFLKDESGRYVYLNNAYEKQFALTKDWHGKTDFDFWPKESAELFRANDYEILQSGQVKQYLEDSTDQSGTRHCWLAYKFSFADSSNRRYVGGIGINITDRVRAEEALKEARDSLEQKVRERTMELQNLMKQLEGSRNALRSLASELVLSEERERKRIAAVLHDEICQTLAVAKMRVDMLQRRRSMMSQRRPRGGQGIYRSVHTGGTRPDERGRQPPAVRHGDRRGVYLAGREADGKPSDPDPMRHPRFLQGPGAGHEGDPLPVDPGAAEQHREAQRGGQRLGLHPYGQRPDPHGGQGRRRGVRPEDSWGPQSEGGFGLFSIQERLKAFDAGLQIESAQGKGTVVKADLPSGLEKSK